MKNILENTNKEARNFLMKSQQYCNLPLPEYFDFDVLLGELERLSDLSVHKWKPWDEEGINYNIFKNKDGEYAWRKFQLIHPVLYVELVKHITTPSNWNLLKDKFKEFQSNKKIVCTSIPILDENTKTKSIYSWKKNFEKESIRLSLEYNYLFNTDIVDCYGSIYTHSISWALHTKPVAKKKRKDMGLLGNFIDKRISAMNNAQTNGIPQGSVLMDFIAEIVLGYVDLILSEELNRKKIKKYKIIRHRDDYRVFVNSPEDGKEIVKVLSQILAEMGMRLSKEKTDMVEDFVVSSVKSDRVSWMLNGNSIFLLDSNSDGITAINQRSLLDTALIIKNFSDNHRNAGALTNALKSFNQRIDKAKRINDVEVIISVLVSIMYLNPRFYYNISSLLSKLVSHLNKKNKKKVLTKIKKKFEGALYTEYLDLWIQYISLDIHEYSYENKLSQSLTNKNIEIWNIDNLTRDVREIFKKNPIINKKILADVKKNPIIKYQEIQPYSG